jgi:4-amino-4-deoxy-L-arabinose transferase-like glycosyltransferase
MATGTQIARRRGPLGIDAAAARRLRWSGAAWGAAGVTALFVALSAWWLARDDAVPFGGGAQHLFAALLFRRDIVEGHPLTIFEARGYYPPAIRLFGALALLAGGMHVASAVLAQNLVFVPLLALACFGIGRVLAGPRAGLLAVVFALGAPLVAEQFHVFMLDAPEAALVAVTAWLVLASERFARVGIAALAGLALGVALLSKQFAPLYLVGLIAAVLARGGGWRNRRGIAAFAGVALLVAGPWYLRHVGDWKTWGSAAGSGPRNETAFTPASTPPRFSGANLTWYGWATLNTLLFAPLAGFAAVGITAAVVRVARVRARLTASPAVELLCGLAGGWLAITALRHHDARYTLPFIVYLAVLGTAWIVRLRPSRQAAAVALLLAAVAAAHLGATFGAGRAPEQQPLSNGRIHEGEGVPPRDRVVVYDSLDYLVSGPQRDGNLLALMRGLRRAGVTRVAWVDQGDVNDHHFEAIGLIVFAWMAGLKVDGYDPPAHGRQLRAVLIRARLLDSNGPCAWMDNGDGVWARIDSAGSGRDWCPGS